MAFPRKMMEDSKAGKIPGSKSGKSTMSASGTNMKDFRLEYAKSGAAKCGVCEEKIKKVCGRAIGITTAGSPRLF